MAVAEPLVSRELALGQLRGALEQATLGRGRLVVVSGDAGIGKSALVTELARGAEASGALVIWGRAWEFGEAPPYFPFRGMFAALGLDAPALAAEASPFSVWELVLAALSRHSYERTLVCLFDDVHAADLATLDLLALLAQPVRTLRVLVVVTARLNDPRVDERAAQRLVRMARDGDDLRLEPLDEAAVRVLAERVLGRHLSEGALSQLMARSSGNPLFVLECARALRSGSGGSSSGGSGPGRSGSGRSGSGRSGSGRSGSGSLGHELPATIRSVVLERVRLLPEGTQAALAALSILGREASARTIAKLRDQLPAKVIDELGPACRSGILEEPEPGRFGFTHILVRDAIEDSLGAVERARLHALATRVLETEARTPEVLVERARHALSAPSDGAPCIELGLEAVKLLERQGAYDRAHAMYRRIEDARRLGQLEPASPAERFDQARVALAAGRFGEARAICSELAAVAEEHDDPELLARTALLFGSELRPGIVDATLVQMLERARALGAGAGGPLEARLLARLAAALQPAPDPQVPIAMAREAVALGERCCD